MNLELPTNLLKRIAVIGLSVGFVLSGFNHFQKTDFYVSMMPSYLPAPLALVYISGVFEILGGLGLLPSRIRRFASWGLIALLIAVFPANVEMAVHSEKFADVAAPWALYARLPFQPVFIAWVYFAALKKNND